MIGNDPRYQAIIDQYTKGAYNAPYQSMDYTPSPYYNPIYDIRTEQIEAGELPPGSRFPNPQLPTQPPAEDTPEEPFDPCPPGYQLIDGVCQPDTMFDRGSSDGDGGPTVTPESGVSYSPEQSQAQRLGLPATMSDADLAILTGESGGAGIPINNAFLNKYSLLGLGLGAINPLLGMGYGLYNQYNRNQAIENLANLGLIAKDPSGSQYVTTPDYSRGIFQSIVNADTPRAQQAVQGIMEQTGVTSRDLEKGDGANVDAFVQAYQQQQSEKYSQKEKDDFMKKVENQKKMRTAQKAFATPTKTYNTDKFKGKGFIGGR